MRDNKTEFPKKSFPFAYGIDFSKEIFRGEIRLQIPTAISR